jgi:hypothetical protein
VTHLLKATTLLCALAAAASAAERNVPPSEHWSTRSLAQPAVPTQATGEWVRNPIDAFIAAAHDAHGLTPAPEADRRTLIRRLTFDLHGLPTTPEDVESFVNDTDPDAYERLVDQLLASPRYGERWARHWLDVAHYGETHGFDKDHRRDNAWPYRDYVIRSFNEDKPYPRFVQEQIAGDVLWPDEPDGIIAAGFLAAGPWDFVGQTEVREDTVEKRRVRNLDRDDIVASVFNTFMSATVQCSRCHDHKFDPISLEDYYGLQAVFADIDRADRAYEPVENAQQRRRLQDERANLERELSTVREEIAKRLPKTINDLRAKIPEWQKELAAADQGKSPTNGYHSVVRDTPDHVEWVQVDLGEAVTLDRIELVPARPTDYKDTPGFGFPIRFDVRVSADETFGADTIVLDSTQEDYPNPGDERVVIETPGRDARYVRVTATRLWERNQDYAFALGELLAYADGKEVAHGKPVTADSSIEFGRWRASALVDGFTSRERLGDAQDSELALRIEEAEKQIEQAEREHLTEDLLQKRRELSRSIGELRQREQQLPAPKQVYSVKPVHPRPIHVLDRGNVENQGPRAEPAVLQHLPELNGGPLAAERHPRAALAEWVTDPANGLTWRSIVNRVWHYHFGQGLVTTPNDFGWAGADPSHPDLLDWLAVEFRDVGGSFKHLHKLMVTSAAYRQQSLHNENNAAIDAGNRYLWRMNRRKLDAESLRDSILVVSGSMDFTMGGPSVELFNYTHDHSPRYDYVAMDNPETFRRSVYRYVVRSVPDPLFETFDCADPNISTPKRNQTLTAQQALTLLNDGFVLHQAERFADRLREVSSEPAEQVRTAYRIALGREPDDNELRELTAFTTKHGAANLARLIFNLNEYLFVD